MGSWIIQVNTYILRERRYNFEVRRWNSQVSMWNSQVSRWHFQVSRGIFPGEQLIRKVRRCVYFSATVESSSASCSLFGNNMGDLSPEISSIFSNDSMDILAFLWKMEFHRCLSKSAGLRIPPGYTNALGIKELAVSLFNINTSKSSPLDVLFVRDSWSLGGAASINVAGFQPIRRYLSSVCCHANVCRDAIVKLGNYLYIHTSIWISDFDIIIQYRKISSKIL